MDILILSLSILVILGVSIVWTNARGAPWVPTSMVTVHQMLELAEVQPDELIYDLGCGDGRILVTAALKYHARGVGIELDPLRWLWCQLLVTMLGLRDRVEIRLGDFFQQDLSQADVVACYLLPDTNKKLQDKLLNDLRSGTRVVSNTFIFPGIKEAAVKGKARLYIFSPQHTQAAYLKELLRKSAET